jgi:Fe-S-cluster-containing dehydrogenase component/DMSO reductase anchor subunit
MNTSGFIFDYSKCVGCHACIVACYNENKTNPPIAWRQVNSLNQNKIPLSGFLNLSIACNHCIDAPCIKACPASAYLRDDQTGAVIHQPLKCIGCKYCTWACPYDAPKYNLKRGVVEKCNLCNQLIIKGLKPACAHQCPTGALSFGPIEIIDQTISIGIPLTKYQPRIITLGSYVLNKITEMDKDISGLTNSEKPLAVEKVDGKIHVFEEWPLVLFTYIFAFLSGWVISFKDGDSSIQKYIFISLGIFAFVLSAFHLGKPLRAARSILNLKTSWLSREILLSGLFIFTSVIYLFFYHSLYFLIANLLIGLLLLFSIEMVYSVTKKKYHAPLHSSNTVLTGLMFGFYFTGLFKLVVALIVIKALLYLMRKKEVDNLDQFWIVILTLARTLGGLFIPLSMIFYSNPINFSLLLLCLLVGELIDRFEFYNDIYIDSPTRILKNTYNELVTRNKK